MKNSILILLFFLSAMFSCTKKGEFTAGFDNIHDRVWVGRDFWSIPLEDWKVENGKLLCTGVVPDSRVNLLTHVLSPEQGNFKVSVDISLINRGEVPGSAGLMLGITDEEDPDVRAACYFGKGIQAGVSLLGYAFLNDKRVELPGEFDSSVFNITVKGNNKRLQMTVTGNDGTIVAKISCAIKGIKGLIAVLNNPDTGENEKPGKSNFIFDNLHISGKKVAECPGNAFGPVLWTMYTLSKKTLKIMALLPPIGISDNQQVSLQLKKEDDWEPIDNQNIEPGSRTAVFKLGNWDTGKETPYRIEYIEKGKDGTVTPYYYEGIIRSEPVERPLKLASLTCQFRYGFPYSPLVKNLRKLDPDMLYFSGDQIYEGNGGYPIRRWPADVAILSYLGKYYMFGWAFGEVMRDRPTICTPDDHDVFHGNLWGEGGIAVAGNNESGDTGGFIEPVEMVNVVNRTQCGQLPDPYDPSPAEQGMSVWYTALTYGRVSFAITSDRIFKTAPDAVSDWTGRHDHIKEPRKDLSFLDKPGVDMFGDRQFGFLNDWISDWQDADFKVLLSQTVLANVATHHGELEGYLYGDLDSGGWPKSGRDKVIRLLRKVAGFHINGDQHIPSLVQYGLEDFRDAGWSFCPPAITVGYKRWFLPDELGYPVVDRPSHGYPNTGQYTDAFGNKNFVYAIGNPGKITNDTESRYNQAQIRSSGFGMVTFNKQERTITIDAWRFFADVENPNPIRDQFPGWPLTISQFDNLGPGAGNVLPEITLNLPEQVICIRNEITGEPVQQFRMHGTVIQPVLHESGTYTIAIGEGENIRKIKGLTTRKNGNTEKIRLDL